MSDDMSTLRGEINALAGETIALQVILIALLKTMRSARVLSHEAIDGTINNAVDFLVDQQIRLGKSAAFGHSAHAVRVAEDIRKATQDQRPPSGGVGN